MLSQYSIPQNTLDKKRIPSWIIAKTSVINEEKKKLKVMVKIFGRKNLLELSYMQVEKEV